MVDTFREMPLDGPGAEEQLGPDIGVRETLARESGDLLFLWRELVACLGAALSDRLTGGDQLAAGALGKPLHADGAEHLVSRTKLVACVGPTSLAPQPLPVEQMRAGELGTEPGRPEPLDRLAIETIGVLAVTQQRPRTRQRAQRPVRAGRPRQLNQSIEGVARSTVVAQSRRCLDELGQRPHLWIGIDVVRGHLACCGGRLVVVAEAVVEDRGRPLRHPVLPPCPSAVACSIVAEISRRPRLPSLPSPRASAPRQEEVGCRSPLPPCDISAMRRRRRPGLHRCVVQCQRTEEDRQLSERTGDSNDVGLLLVDLARGVGVPRHMAGHRGCPPPPKDLLADICASALIARCMIGIATARPSVASSRAPPAGGSCHPDCSEGEGGVRRLGRCRGTRPPARGVRRTRAEPSAVR